MSQNYTRRFVAIDLLRSIAILGMVTYHAAYDLQMFYGWTIDIFSGGWKVLQIATATLFLLLVGITSSFSGKHPFKRFVRIGSAALAVSVVTYVIDPETYVRFGILHLIAASALLMPLVRRLNMWLVVPGIILIALGNTVASMRTGTSLMLPLGIRPPGFVTVDYFPLIPWFGVMLIGYDIGYLIYVQRHRDGRRARNSKLLDLAATPGRHSLLLYLIHQPVIIGLLWLTLGNPAF